MNPLPTQTFFLLVRRPLALAALLMLGGCASTFNSLFRTPALKIPAQYTLDSAVSMPVTPASDGTPWWTRLNDPVLDQLVAEVLARNNNLAAATIRVRRAQLQAGLADRALQPALAGSASTGARRSLESDATSARSSGDAGSVGGIVVQGVDRHDVGELDADHTQCAEQQHPAPLVGQGGDNAGGAVELISLEPEQPDVATNRRRRR